MCVQVCFLGRFTCGEDGKSHVVKEAKACIDCGHCVAACPGQAINHPAYDLSEFSALDITKRPDYDTLVGLLRLRRSRREFRDTPVSKEDLYKLLKAAALAPSALNRQSMQYTVITDRSMIGALSARAAAFLRRTVDLSHNPFGRLIFRLMLRGGYKDFIKMLPEMEAVVRGCDAGRDVILYNAPCVVMLHAPADDTLAPENACYNAANLLLTAETLGLGACVIGFMTESAARDKEIRRLAGIPQGHRVLCTIVIGHPKFAYRRTIPKDEPNVRFVEYRLRV
jgi:nitroreductase